MADTAAGNKCEHARTRLIAKDNEAHYVECLDCGAILEASEMKNAPASAEPPHKTDAAAKTAELDESLSDA